MTGFIVNRGVEPSGLTAPATPRMTDEDLACYLVNYPENAMTTYGAAVGLAVTALIAEARRARGREEALGKENAIFEHSLTISVRSALLKSEARVATLEAALRDVLDFRLGSFERVAAALAGKP